jgi:antitoxin HicB
MNYPIAHTPDSNETFLVDFPDLPWVHTYGETREDALTQAHDALLTAIAFLIKERQPVPVPRRSAAEPEGYVVVLSALVAAKIGLHNVMLEAGMSKSDLARQLDVHRPQVDRLLDIDHPSSLDQLERAIEKAGGRVEIQVRRRPADEGKRRSRPAAAVLAHDTRRRR